MLFNLFGKKDGEADNQVFVDRAYTTTEAKLKACVELAKAEPGYLFICWFNETMNMFKDFFKQHGVDDECIVMARYLNAGLLKTKTPVFTEHYPLHAKELELIKNWDTGKIIVYSALDEPLFKHFGSDKIIPLMKMMGMKEDEVIEHSLVTKSIIKGQEKIAEQVSFEHAAISQADWMKKNVT
ncbi:MAG: hypothetical protein IPL84_03125 [Chitinophagaceae bacterium]|nr:hypothetical protein [Chitinophagaceae bacterium]